MRKLLNTCRPGLPRVVYRQSYSTLPNTVINTPFHEKAPATSEEPISDRTTHEKLLVENNRASYAFTPSWPPDPSEWRHLINTRQRLYGSRGVQATWRDMRKAEYDLPVSSQEAKSLWEDFLADDTIRGDVVDYAFLLYACTGRVYGGLFSSVLGKILANPTHTQQEALEAYNAFRRRYVITPTSITLLARSAVKSRNALATFKIIYARCLHIHGRRTYDSIVPDLCRRGEWSLAIQWHKFLVAHGDMPFQPSPITALQQARPDLASHVDSQSPGTYTEQNRYIAPASDKSSSGENESRSLFDLKLPSTTANIDPISDNVCARLFATRTISVKFIISGLKLFESRRIGPIAIRELFLRAKSADEAIEFIRMLREADISIEPTPYTRAIRTFALTRQFDVLQSLVESDLHPDTLDDSTLQYRLLEMYKQQGDDLSAKRTIAILRLITDIPEQKLTTLTPQSDGQRNRRLRRGRLERLSVLLEDKIFQGTIEHTDFNLFVKAALDFRRQAKRKQLNAEALTDMFMFTNLCMAAYKRGFEVPPGLLAELLKRWGMAGKLNQHSRLFLFILRMFRSNNRYFGSSPNVHQRLRSSLYETSNIAQYRNRLDDAHQSNALNRIFGPKTVQGIIVWGMKIGMRYIIDCHAGRIKGIPGPSSLFYGLRIVQSFYQQGLNLDIPALSQFLRQRLFLFSKFAPVPCRRHNRRAQVMNHHSLEEMVLAIEKIWTGPSLFPELHGTAAGNRNPLLLRRGDATPLLIPTLLEGLLNRTTRKNTEPLSYVQRIKKRIEFRKAIFSGIRMKSHATGRILDDSEMAEVIRKHAIDADFDLYGRGVCTGQPSYELGVGDIFQRRVASS
jgi:hypothetical protein